MEESICYTVFIAGAWMAVLGRLFLFFPLYFQGQLKVVYKSLPWFPKYWFWARFCSCLGCRVFPIYPVWSRTSLQFVDKEPADVAASIMRLKAKVTPVGPECLLRKGADVWRQYEDEGASNEWTSPKYHVSVHFSPPITCQVLNLIQDIRQIFHIYWTWKWRMHNEDYWGSAGGAAAESKSGGDEDID